MTITDDHELNIYHHEYTVDDFQHILKYSERIDELKAK